MKNFPKLGNLTGLWIGLIAVFGTATAGAEEHFLICIPGAPGSSADAAERVDGFLSVLESDTGPMTGHYATRADECDRILEMHSPRFALFSHGELARRAKALKAVPILEVEGLEQGPNQYHLVVQKGTEEQPLSGALLSPHWRDFSWISSLFEGVDWSGFEGKRKGALRSLKKLSKGKIRAVLLNETERRAMAELPFADALSVVKSSVELPGLAIVELGGLSSKGKALRKAGTSVCKGAPAQCKGVEIRSLKSTTADRYSRVIGTR